MRLDLLVVAILGIGFGTLAGFVIAMVLHAGADADDPAARIEATRNRNLMRRRIRLLKSGTGATRFPC